MRMIVRVNLTKPHLSFQLLFPLFVIGKTYQFADQAGGSTG